MPEQGPEHERPHPWPDVAIWQESVAFWWYDAAAGAGGFGRFGFHPVEGYGRSMLFAFSEANGVRFRRVDERIPVQLGDEPASSLRVGTSEAAVDGDGRVTLSWSEPECEADLAFAGFHAPHGFTGAGDEHLTGTVYGGHLECAGRLAGTFRIGAHVMTVDALAHRDRSWGPRDMTRVHTNRMITGTMGPELSFAANTIQLSDGSINDIGHVVRDGVVEPFERFVILPSIHLDGYSVAGGVLKGRLASGEMLAIECETIAGQLTPFDGYLCSEHISVARCGDLVGFCDNELTNNPRNGTEMPRFLQYVDGGEGLSPLPRPDF